MSDPATEALIRLWESHGDLIAEIAVEKLDDGTFTFNVALSKDVTDEPIGIVSYNGATVSEALKRAAAGESQA